MAGRALLPCSEWLLGYRKDWLRPDVIAGATTAAVVVPKAMAYATIAGLPVEVGLYTVLVPMLCYALFGTSRVLSVSTTTTIAILAGTQLSQVAPDGDRAALLSAAAMLTLLVGGLLALASLLRLGFVANFISEPVLVGFKTGIGLVIVLDQVPKLLGVHFAKGNFLENMIRTTQSIPDTSLATLAVALATLAVLIALERFAPRAPAPLVAVAAGIAGFGLLHLPVESVGQVPQGLPHWVRPDLSVAAALWPGALGIALMSFTETIAAARAFAQSGEPTPRPNQELFATGFANAVGALFGAMPAGGGTSQTAVNRLAGAHTPFASVVTAVLTLLTMLLLAPLIGLLPQATLAAVVIVYSIGLIQPDEFRVIRNVRRMEFRWALAAVAGVVLLGTLKGILVAVVLSLGSLAHQVADPPVYAIGRKRGTNVFRPRSCEHADDETFPGLLLVRIEGRVFFANADRIGHKLRPLVEEARPRVVALDLRAVPDLEYTALKMLSDAEEREREHGVELWLVGLNPEVLTVVQRSPLGARLGRERMHMNLETAVAKYLA
ncbi:MAG: SulP family inorganic anion transporter [Candidatus Eisenbacteria bacterium]|uniref:SulP family inorganic anion transporter n=1 Tax=Eiseniibacteriota bacterium TaxID=2212470 RepID=A0A538U354_UNCEI|nr:MAG: SulP family inorganic anion transporter [Candidatus Eisenbacteria bacterium]